MTYIAAQFLFDIARELDRPSFGEENAVVQSQPAHLPFIIGTIVGILTGFIHEAVPHVDIFDASTFGAGAIRFVEIGCVARGAGAANWRQTDPDDLHALALKSSNCVVDAPRVNLFPFLAAKLGRATSFLGTLR